MTDETIYIRALDRIAAVLGVPVSSFYGSTEAGVHPLDDRALRTAVAEFLRAFAAASDPEQRQRCIAWLEGELERLRGGRSNLG